VCAVKSGKRDTSSYDFRPSAERFAETISLALRAARDTGHSHDQVLETALQKPAPPATWAAQAR
jgi:hypothetical protein